MPRGCMYCFLANSSVGVKHIKVLSCEQHTSYQGNRSISYDNSCTDEELTNTIDNYATVIFFKSQICHFHYLCFPCTTKFEIKRDKRSNICNEIDLVDFESG